jgi:hypothetical protein
MYSRFGIPLHVTPTGGANEMTVSSMEVYLQKKIFLKNSGNSNNRLLRKYGPKRDEVIGEWRKQRNEGLSDMYCSPNIVRLN